MSHGITGGLEVALLGGDTGCMRTGGRVNCIDCDWLKHIVYGKNLGFARSPIDCIYNNLLANLYVGISMTPTEKTEKICGTTKAQACISGVVKVPIKEYRLQKTFGSFMDFVCKSVSHGKE